MSNLTDKRKEPRVDTSVPSVFCMDKEYRATVINTSNEGLGLVVDARIEDEAEAEQKPLRIFAGDEVHVGVQVWKRRDRNKRTQLGIKKLFKDTTDHVCRLHTAIEDHALFKKEMRSRHFQSKSAYSEDHLEALRRSIVEDPCWKLGHYPDSCVNCPLNQDEF